MEPYRLTIPVAVRSNIHTIALINDISAVINTTIAVSTPMSEAANFGLNRKRP